MDEKDMSWLEPGKQAVILQPFGYRPTLRAEMVTIEKVLKRDVVLSNGDRFNKTFLSRQIGGSYGTTLYLVSPDDPRVAETRRAIRLRNLRIKASSAYENWSRDKASIDEVITAMTALKTAEGEN